MKSGSDISMTPDAEVKPKYHLFGHAHEAYGEETIDGITFSNGSSLHDNYYEACHKPRIIEINGK